MKMPRLRWLGAALHAGVFMLTLLTATAQSKPLLDVPARWGTFLLLLADIPISVIGFSLI
jgi:hypothetical protein